MDILERLTSLENTVKIHESRLDRIEKTTNEDHEALKIVKKDVVTMKNDVADVKKDMGTIKTQNTLMCRSVEKLTRIIKIVGAMALVAIAYIVFKNEQTSAALVSLGTAISKLFV